MMLKDFLTQIIELMIAVFALIALPIGLICVEAAFTDRLGQTFWTVYAIWPAQFADYVRAQGNILDAANSQHIFSRDGGIRHLVVSSS
jgi:hypothetical protein